MSMSEFHRKILEKSGPDLLNDLDADDVLPYLISDEVITRDDVDKINSGSLSRKEKVSKLLMILPRRGMTAYTSLLNSLARIPGSIHLYKIMKEHEESWQPPEENELPTTTECIDSISTDVHMGDAGILETKPNLLGGQPINPHKPLMDKDLLEIAKGLGEHWETLATALGLSRAVVYQCKENNKYNTQTQIFDMLYKWKCKNGKKATVSVLLEACKSIELLEEEVYKFLYTR